MRYGDGRLAEFYDVIKSDDMQIKARVDALEEAQLVARVYAERDKVEYLIYYTKLIGHREPPYRSNKMSRLTKRVWRWELTKYHEVADERGLSWIRPTVYLSPYETLVHNAMQSLSRGMVDRISGENAVLSRLKQGAQNRYWDKF